VLLLNEDPDNAVQVNLSYPGFSPAASQPTVYTYRNGGTGCLKNAFHEGLLLRIVDESPERRKTQIHNVTFVYIRVRNHTQPLTPVC